MTGPRLLALAGPTASGKSALALHLARHIELEIVSVDSAQVYRGMDIGTAKPSAADRAAVPHHLIDLIEPHERYSAARFVLDARRAIQEIRQRGRVALLVGGTMLYFKALIDGLDRLPEADPAWRADLEEQASRVGWPALHAQLAQVDPASAARLAPHDAQRIQRALEVWHLSGRPLSQLHSAGPRDTLDIPLIALEPQSREGLHRRIADRFDAMLAAGLVDEVRRLRERPGLHADLPSMRCVGYRQAWQALQANDLGRLRERGIAATRQLAKRQLTWLRGMRRHAVASDAPDIARQVLEAAQRLLANDGPADTPRQGVL